MSDRETFIINTAPGEEYAERFRFWQGCPTILRTPGGRLFAGWYSGGVREPDLENYNLLVRSEDGGMTWSSPELVISGRAEENYIAIDIQLWLDPRDRMWLFFAKIDCAPGSKPTDPDHWTTWAMVCDDPDAGTLRWSAPRFIVTGFLRTQPTVLSDGSWVMCAYDRSSEYLCYARSRDEGRSWERCRAAKRLTDSFDEPMILERRDHSLLLFARDAKPLLVSTESPDLTGATWKPAEYTCLLSSSSRFFLRRLRSGRVLLIRNDASRMRTDLVAELSEDDGESWKFTLPLDGGDPLLRPVSYPDAVETPDGAILIVYDSGRTTFKEIRMARITEEDIIAGKLTDFSSYRARIISKAPGNLYDGELYRRKMDRWQTWAKTLTL